jgi:glyoxylase-like metal-dependent hydrolase (beta-lactamase superfamily II)
MSLKFAVGDLTIHRIIEQETTFLPALELLPGLTPDLLAANKSWMRDAGALNADDVLILCFQSYIVRTPHHTILVDSCIGNDKPRPLRPKWNMKTDDTYLRALARAGFSVEDIDFVMCTHLHVDHVGWNTRLEGGRWVPTFPNARYLFGKDEFDYWTEQHAKTPVPPFGDSVLPVVEAKRAEIVRNDYAIGDHVRILPTPGHTPGHVAFTFGRGKDDAVFSGDLMHSPLQTRYPELSAKFDVDQAQAAATRRNFLERYCDTDTLCCTAHFPSPDIPRQLDAAELLGDIAIGHGLARRNAAGDVIDAAMKFRNAIEIERHVVEIVRLALKQRDHALDRVLHLGRRRRLRDVTIALEDAGTGLVLVSHRQLHPVDAARTPHDAATADRSIKKCKMIAGHGWLQV